MLVLGLVLGQAAWADGLTKSPKEVLFGSELHPERSVHLAPGNSNEAPQAHTPLVVLYDQPSASVNNSTSQNFEAVYDDYDNQAADDFVVTAGSGWNVTTVFA